MEDVNNSKPDTERLRNETPQLLAVLKEMKAGLDVVTSKVQALTAKVKANGLPTTDGLSYLEAKHLLLLNYCQSLVYYLLRKANGFSIEGHPVVRSLVEIRLFLEKIRPIDKKLQYQIQKFTKVTESSVEQQSRVENRGSTGETKDLLQYRPNPDLLVPRTNTISEDNDGVYQPPKFAPTTMEDDDKTSRKERNAIRMGKLALKRASQSDYVRGLMDEIEDRPEEVRETNGIAESKELSRYLTEYEERAKQEEDIFTRAPITKKEKQLQKHLQKSRNGLLGLTDDFYHEINTLPLGGEASEQPSTLNRGIGQTGKFKKRKMKR